jgi:predicted small metal-binding protein
MTKSYTCRDVGVDCDWKTSAETEDDVMAAIQGKRRGGITLLMSGATW